MLGEEPRPITGYFGIPLTGMLDHCGHRAAGSSPSAEPEPLKQAHQHDVAPACSACAAGLGLRGGTQRLLHSPRATEDAAMSVVTSRQVATWGKQVRARYVVVTDICALDDAHRRMDHLLVLQVLHTETAELVFETEAAIPSP